MGLKKRNGRQVNFVSRPPPRPAPPSSKATTQTTTDTRGKNKKTGIAAICVDCGKSFKFGFLLNRHAKDIHGDGQRFACEICPKTYSVLRSLDQHLIKKHKEVAEAIGKRPTKHAVKICPNCSREFASGFSLKRHIASPPSTCTKKISEDARKGAAAANDQNLHISVPNKPVFSTWAQRLASPVTRRHDQNSFATLLPDTDTDTDTPAIAYASAAKDDDDTLVVVVMLDEGHYSENELMDIDDDELYAIWTTLESDEWTDPRLTMQPEYLECDDAIKQQQQQQQHDEEESLHEKESNVEAIESAVDYWIRQQPQQQQPLDIAGAETRAKSP